MGDRQQFQDTICLHAGHRSARHGQRFDLSANGLVNTGIWSNGTTAWVTDRTANKLFAYTLATGVRDEARDIALSGFSPVGTWGNGTTIWVADDGLAVYAAPKALHRVYSYRLPPSSPNDVHAQQLGCVAPFR